MKCMAYTFHKDKTCKRIGCFLYNNVLLCELHFWTLRKNKRLTVQIDGKWQPLYYKTYELDNTELLDALTGDSDER